MLIKFLNIILRFQFNLPSAFKNIFIYYLYFCLSAFYVLQFLFKLLYNFLFFCRVFFLFIMIESDNSNYLLFFMHCVFFIHSVTLCCIIFVYVLFIYLISQIYASAKTSCIILAKKMYGSSVRM